MPDRFRDPHRPLRRRATTRQRLLDAAFKVFVAKGFGRTRIDDVCRAAGYSKGAFYSNFHSLEELFFAIYQQQSQPAVTQTTKTVSTDATNPGFRIAQWANQLLIDRDWLLINTDFVSYAARNPEVAAELTAHRQQLRGAVTAQLAAFITEQHLPLPPTLNTPTALARAIVTIYDGVIYQLLLDMTEAEVRQHFINLVSALISTPSSD